MPVSEEEWEEAPEHSREDPANGSGTKAAIATFLQNHSEQAFTLPEITENVELPVGNGGENSGITGTLKTIAMSAGKKRVIRYFTNQLVAEGHVQTRILLRNGSERVYYRSTPAN
jgi:hypothetical protein